MIRLFQTIDRLDIRDISQEETKRIGTECGRRGQRASPRTWPSDPNNLRGSPWRLATEARRSMRSRTGKGSCARGAGCQCSVPARAHGARPRAQHACAACPSQAAAGQCLCGLGRNLPRPLPLLLSPLMYGCRDAMDTHGCVGGRVCVCMFIRSLHVHAYTR